MMGVLDQQKQQDPKANYRCARAPRAELRSEASGHACPVENSVLRYSCCGATRLPSSLRAFCLLCRQSPCSAWLDAVALPASFGGSAYSSVGADRNPTAWQDGAFFLSPNRPQSVSLEAALKLIRCAYRWSDGGTGATRSFRLEARTSSCGIVWPTMTNVDVAWAFICDTGHRSLWRT